MTRRDELLALADRVEAATGADTLLDALVSAAVNDAVLEVQDGCRAAFHSADGARWVSVPVLPYTASIDAALTLVPSGWRIHTGDFTIRDWSMAADCESATATVIGRDGPEHGHASTPALAITAAALRALAQETPE